MGFFIVICAIIVFIYIVQTINSLIETYKKGLKSSELERRIRDYGYEIEILKKKLELEKKELIFNYELKLSKQQVEYENQITKLKDNKHIEAMKKKEKLLRTEFQVKKDLASYKLNPIMIKLYDDFFKKSIEDYQNYFSNKIRPSMKSAEILGEIKNDYKNLQIENRQLKLMLSEFIPDEETNTKEEKEESSFDVEEKAYKYGRLPKEQWEKLTYVEKLDVVLERYKNSWKDKLNIGLEFERYCGYLYEKKGYQVKYWGILNGKSDGGIDLVAKSKTKTLYIQCKYWGTSKTIRENTISQLFGSALKMALDNGETYETFIKKVKSEKIRIILLTKTEISEEAKSFCEKLNVIYQEKIEIKQNYPRVKLVYGEEKIFYIPTDLQYDNISFGSTNKEYDRAFTCKEAEEKGYRHCYKWRGN